MPVCLFVVTNWTLIVHIVAAQVANPKKNQLLKLLFFCRNLGFGCFGFSGTFLGTCVWCFGSVCLVWVILIFVVVIAVVSLFCCWYVVVVVVFCCCWFVVVVVVVYLYLLLILLLWLLLLSSSSSSSLFLFLSFLFCCSSNPCFCFGGFGWLLCLFCVLLIYQILHNSHFTCNFRCRSPFLSLSPKTPFFKILVFLLLPFCPHSFVHLLLFLSSSSSSSSASSNPFSNNDPVLYVLICLYYFVVACSFCACDSFLSKCICQTLPVSNSSCFLFGACLIYYYLFFLSCCFEKHELQQHVFRNPSFHEIWKFVVVALVLSICCCCFVVWLVLLFVCCCCFVVVVDFLCFVLLLICCFCCCWVVVVVVVVVVVCDLLVLCIVFIVVVIIVLVVFLLVAHLTRVCFVWFCFCICFCLFSRYQTTMFVFPVFSEFFAGPKKRS